MSFFYLLLQLIAAILVAPLFDGMARKLRAKFQSRIGPSIFQTYRDLLKLIKRGRTKSHSASFIYQIAPYLMFATTAAMFCALPITYGSDAVFAQFSDIFVLIYLGALYRFMFIIAGFDTANPFAGVGSSREATIGFYSEAVSIICLIVVMLGAGSSSLPHIASIVSLSEGNYGYLVPSYAIASTAFLWVMYVETGRKPYDLAEAEQELQEGVLGEYCGKDLAIIDVALMLKQFSMLGFFLMLFEPWSFENPLLSLLLFLAEIGVLYVFAVFIDNFGPRFTMNKGMKRTMLFPFSIACIALMLYIIGV
ncbi:NADH-quinone oxidoreductase subunit H [Sulfurospirillum diekertiae]|uniref:NADH-quinone oxidoreductase subunit H n=1 Tax=Sulfurospirillum diekertiae TaxID=1854492 RepID=A0A6G9VR01_9BACT|nr:complex I subunit 1 family protein [Sulfurospirillum diekertiae]QIR75305.1 NADH-quinone oxidoreductase subunit H [Sulfurospirillum diekertiae]QIR77957.1 NADH-quinone oxidoreductase subunit H [Sulfurospirillum diekertiae]